MSSLAGIPVTVEHASGNIAPLLHEIGHALERLIEHGEPSIIDLRGLPLAPGEEGRILEFLGTGEVRAEFEASGRSTVNESRFPGVWIVTHHDATGDIMSRLIEITRVPEILLSQAEELSDSHERLVREVRFLSEPSGSRRAP
jgi:HupH hydrogenase expression protein, C-terminal conserved region